VGTAFGLVDQVQSTRVRVSRVVARLEAERGLAEATIVGHRAPHQVRPGQRVEVRLVVRAYYGGGRRTVAFPLRIPRGAHGRLRVIVHGPSSSSVGGSTLGLPASLAGALGAGGPPPLAPAASIAPLRRQIAGLSNYDGLWVRLPGRAARHVYRDPALVITGRTVLSFAVR
jgi:hypothetical protein